MVKNLPAGDTRDAGLIPESGRSPEEGNGDPLQYSCMGNPMNRGAWWATVHGSQELDMTQQLNNKNHIFRDCINCFTWINSLKYHRMTSNIIAPFRLLGNLNLRGV